MNNKALNENQCFTMLATAGKKEDKAVIFRRIANERGLSYRTVKGLSILIKNDLICPIDIGSYLDPVYYTFENMLRIATGEDEIMSEIIPEEYYKNEYFIEQAGITALPDGFLEGDDELLTFPIKEGIRVIGNRAFAGCSRLVEILYTKNGSLEEIGAYAFKDCVSLRNGIIPNTIEKLGAESFCGCSSIERFYLPEKIRRIKPYTFASCTGLQTFNTIGYPVDVGDCAFKECISLADMNGVAADIGREAFAGCRTLRSVHFRNIPQLFGTDCFMGCLITKVSGNGSSCQLYSTEGSCELVRHIRMRK